MGNISDLEYLKRERDNLMKEIWEHGLNVKRQIALKELDEDILVEKIKRHS